MNPIEKEFAKEAIRAFLAEYNIKDGGRYEFNPEKIDRMNDIIAYCQKLEKEYGCKIIRCMLEPKYEQGFVEVLFDDEWALGQRPDSLNEFVRTLQACDGLNIATNPAGEDMFQITFFVEKLWVPKSK